MEVTKELFKPARLPAYPCPRTALLWKGNKSKLKFGSYKHNVYIEAETKRETKQARK